MSIICYLLVFITASASLALGEENLLTNSDFEEGLKGWSVPGWKTNAIRPEIDNVILQGPGYGALKAVGQKNRECFVIQKVKFIAKARKYRLAGWMKKEGFENMWYANVSVQCEYKNQSGKNEWKYYGFSSAPHCFRMDWTYFETEFEIPENTVDMQIILRTLHCSGKAAENAPPNRGTVWFDSLSLTPAEDVHAGDQPRQP